MPAGECFLNQRSYEHGEKVAIDRCMTCECHDSVMQCSTIIPEQHCPPLQCPPEQRLNMSGQCCQFCRGQCRADRGSRFWERGGRGAGTVKCASVLSDTYNMPYRVR